jgi:outer membrane protein OmpA-like peptidoglycan-associated protein
VFSAGTLTLRGQKPGGQAEAALIGELQNNLGEENVKLEFSGEATGLVDAAAYGKLVDAVLRLYDVDPAGGRISLRNGFAEVNATVATAADRDSLSESVVLVVGGPDSMRSQITVSGQRPSVPVEGDPSATSNASTGPTTPAASTTASAEVAPTEVESTTSPTTTPTTALATTVPPTTAAPTTTLPPTTTVPPTTVPATTTTVLVIGVPPPAAVLDEALTAKQAELTEVLRTRRVSFQTDLAILDAAGLAAVDEIANQLKDVDTRFEVAGYTDNRGNADRNVQLSQRRADAVVKRLTELGIDPARMVPVGYGSAA